MKRNLKILASITLLILVIIGGCVMAGNNNEGKFKLLGETLDPRGGSAATLMKNGKVLITGGYPAIKSAGIYDPETQKFTRTGDLNFSRYGHSAVLLKDGRVLIVGGFKDEKNYYSKTAEIYDPNTGKFTSIEMNAPLTTNNLTLLQDGRVLISSLANQLEIFDPKSNEFKKTTSCLTVGCPTNTTLLNNGKVLFASGQSRDNQPQLFDYQSESFENTGKMYLSRSFSTATLLKNGEVIIIGGQNNYDDIAQAEIYNSETGIFRQAGKLNQARYHHSAIFLQDGRVLVVGGAAGHSTTLQYFKSAEIYDPKTDSFNKIGDMHYIRNNPTLTKLTDGNILIIGGSSLNKQAYKRPELFIPFKFK